MENGMPLPALALTDFGGIPAWSDEALFAACDVRVAFTGRVGGTSVGPYEGLNLCGYVHDDPAAVVRNRALALEALGAQGCSVFVPRQVHGTRIETVDGDWPPAGERMEAAEADGIVVAVPNVAVQLSFADCLPLILVAPDGAFAVVHAGWRGAIAGIAGKAARALSAETGSDPAQMNAYIGPHIRSECFETGSEVIEQFRAEFGEGVLADAQHVSLAGAVSADLERAGLRAERIADCRVCTMCSSDEYYSYRASGGVCGRNAAFAFRSQPDAADVLNAADAGGGMGKS